MVFRLHQLPGFPVGVVASPEYEMKIIQLRKGDRLASPPRVDVHALASVVLLPDGGFIPQANPGNG